MNKIAILIPLYNNEETIKSVVQSALKLNYPVTVVNDGSTDNSIKNLADLKKNKNLTILHHRENMGKGQAITTGLKALVNKALWAVTLDADGQHNPEDAVMLIDVLDDNYKTIIVGNRSGMNEAHITWKSSFGRKFSNFWVRTSGGSNLLDTQSGFRIYPVKETIDLDVRTKRFQFEVEVLVKANLSGFSFKEVTIPVFYPPKEERISHFKPFVDSMRNASLFTRLITLRVLRFIKLSR